MTYERWAVKLPDGTLGSGRADKVPNFYDSKEEAKESIRVAVLLGLQGELVPVRVRVTVEEVERKDGEA